jgi:hypothetical protein
MTFERVSYLLTDLRKIDALVAEHVFGHVVTYAAEEDRHSAEDDGLRIVKDQATAWFDIIPCYSSSIAVAWRVVEKLHEFNPFWGCGWGTYDFPGIQLNPTKGPNGEKGWMCNFGDDTTHEYADTAPMAICLAALKARGIAIE